MAFLELNNVGKGFGVPSRRTTVLRNINLGVAEGEFVAIVGFSGAGKTTLVNLIAGLTKPDSGTIALNGVEITQPGPDRGVVFQNYSLLPWLTVFHNVRLAVEQCFPGWNSARKSAQADKYIEMVHLTSARNKRPAELSGGMRQRVSVARALAMEPQILLLDEPLSALDALTRATLQDEISRIWQSSGKTVVLITNDADEGIYLADRIIPMTAGPGATLGPSFNVGLPRPRDRTELNHAPRFKELRRALTDFLLSSKNESRSRISKKLILPAIEPEDLTRRRRVWIGRRGPARRNEMREEMVETP